MEPLLVDYRDGFVIRFHAAPAVGLTRRAAGILLHPTSFAGTRAIGGLGPEADRFLDWAAEAGQSIWQVLPLGPTGHGHSPYAAHSAHAGNPRLIAPERLRDEGLLPDAGADAVASPDAIHAGRVDFDAAIRETTAFLRASWAHFQSNGPAEIRRAFGAFRERPEHAWLEDWVLFGAIKQAHDGAPWTAWDPPLRRRESGALARAAQSLRDERDYRAYLQFLFFRQWDRVRAAAHDRGITILGDAPIYVALDSADVWTRPDLFQIDVESRPTAVAGVPPDYFSATGQLWGNPLYAWERHEEEGFAWWAERVRSDLGKVDLLRIDHFRAFASYWSVPAGATTATEGHWESGPGIRIFEALRRRLGDRPSVADLPLVAEDLGLFSEDVRALLRATGLPGMRVLHFGFDSPDSEHAPSRIPEHCVAYTGTHDNDTTRAWFDALEPEAKSRVLESVGGDGGDVAWALIRTLYATAAERVIVPAQDLLGLGSEARMNTPSVAEGNWAFRLEEGALTSSLADALRAVASTAGRLPAGRAAPA